MNKFIKNLKDDHLFPLGPEATIPDWKSSKWIRMSAPSHWYSTLKKGHGRDPMARKPSPQACMEMPAWFHESFNTKWATSRTTASLTQYTNSVSEWSDDCGRQIFKDDFQGVLPEGYTLIPHDFLIGSEPRWESPLSLFEYPFYAPFSMLTSLYHDRGASILDKWELEDESKGYEVRYQRELASTNDAKFWTGDGKTCRFKREYILKWLRDPTLDLRVRWGVSPPNQLKTGKERFTCEKVQLLWNSYDSPRGPSDWYYLRNDYGHERKDPDRTKGKAVFYGRRFEMSSDCVRLHVGMMPRLMKWTLCSDEACRNETNEWDATRFHVRPSYNDAQDHLYSTPINLLGVFPEQRNDLIKKYLCYSPQHHLHPPAAGNIRRCSPKSTWFHVSTPQDVNGHPKGPIELGWKHIRSFNLCFKRVGLGLYEWKDLGWELPKESMQPICSGSVSSATNQLEAVRWLTTRMNDELKGTWTLHASGPAYTQLVPRNWVNWLTEWINMLEAVMKTDQRGAEYLACMMNELIDERRVHGWDSPRYQLNAEVEFIDNAGKVTADKRHALNVFYKYLPKLTVKMFKKARESAQEKGDYQGVPSYKYLKQLFRKRCGLKVKWHSFAEGDNSKQFNMSTGSLVILVPRLAVSHHTGDKGTEQRIDYSKGLIALSNGMLDSMHVSEASGRHQRGRYPDGDAPSYAGVVRFRASVTPVRAFLDPYISALSSGDYEGYPATQAYGRPYCVIRKSENPSAPDWLLVRSHSTIDEARTPGALRHEKMVNQTTLRRLKESLVTGMHPGGHPITDTDREHTEKHYIPNLEGAIEFPRQYDRHRVPKGFDEQLQLVNSVGQLYHDKSIGQFPVMSVAYAVLYTPVDMFAAEPMEIYNWLKEYCDKLITRSLRSRKYCYANSVWQLLHKLRWWAKSFGLTRKFNRQFPMNKLENIYMKQLIRLRAKNLRPHSGRQTTNVDIYREREGYVRNQGDTEIWKYQR